MKRERSPPPAPIEDPPYRPQARVRGDGTLAGYFAPLTPPDKEKEAEATEAEEKQAAKKRKRASGAAAAKEGDDESEAASAKAASSSGTKRRKAKAEKSDSDDSEPSVATKKKGARASRSLPAQYLLSGEVIEKMSREELLRMTAPEANAAAAGAGGGAVGSNPAGPSSPAAKPLDAETSAYLESMFDKLPATSFSKHFTGHRTTGFGPRACKLLAHKYQCTNLDKGQRT